MLVTTRGRVLHSARMLRATGPTPNSYTATDHTATKLAAVPARLTSSPTTSHRKSRDERRAWSIRSLNHTAPPTDGEFRATETRDPTPGTLDSG
jgi:hypothetical protein